MSRAEADGGGSGAVQKLPTGDIGEVADWGELDHHHYIDHDVDDDDDDDYKNDDDNDNDDNSGGWNGVWHDQPWVRQGGAEEGKTKEQSMYNVDDDDDDDNVDN